MIHTHVGNVGNKMYPEDAPDDFAFVVNRKPLLFKKNASMEEIKARQVNFIAGILADRYKSYYIRNDDSLQCRTLIALDYDDGITVDAETFKKAVHDALGEYTYYLYPTKRNKPVGPRYRLILKPERPFVKGEHKNLIKQIESLIGFKTGDDSNDTWSQMNGLPTGIGTLEEYQVLCVLNHGKDYPINVEVEDEPEWAPVNMDAEPMPQELSHVIIEKYVRENQDYLQDRFNYFNALRVIVKSVQTGEISIEDGESFAEMLACGNPEWMDANVAHFRSELNYPWKTQQTFMSKFDYKNQAIKEVRNMDAESRDYLASNVIKMPARQDETETSPKMSKAKKAKLLAESNIDEFYYVSGTTYVKIPMNGHKELVRTDSKTFKNWLIYLYESAENSMLADGDIRTVIASVDSIAYFKGKREDIYLRIAEKGGKIIVDLCNDKRQVLEIDADGFRVLDESPVLFRRAEDMAELPIPIFENKDDYKRLGNYVNFDKGEDMDMIVAFILATFRPNMPKPILNLTGEAGSGKSMNTKMIRKFIDPAKDKQLLAKEINMKELPLAVTSQYLVAFDNLSGISKEGSDLLCMVSTGGVMTTRRLYTNSEEEVVDLKKVVILNGIDDISKRQDLVSRTVFINTPRLMDADKKPEDDIWNSFEKDYPYIFGSIVNAVSYGLRNRGKNQAVYPRMMDFGRFVGDCASALGWTESYWQGIYIDNQAAGVEQSIETDPFASALVDMMEDFAQDGLFFWEGTASQLLERLARRLHLIDISRDAAFPKANQVKGRLRRIAPSIAAKGITWAERKSSGKRLISIEIGSIEGR
jgi:hypothetical protein